MDSGVMELILARVELALFMQEIHAQTELLVEMFVMKLWMFVELPQEAHAQVLTLLCFLFIY